MKKICLLICVIFTVSCSDPLDKKYSAKGFEEDVKLFEEEGVERESQKLIVQYLIIKKLRKEEIAQNTTYKMILNDAKILKDEEEFKKQELEEKSRLKAMEERAKIDSMSKIINVTLLKKGHKERSYQEYITIKLLFENNSQKDIKGFKGTLIFKDIFGDEVKKIYLKIDDIIKPKVKSYWNGEMKYNQFIDSDKDLLNAKMEKMTTIFEPSTILFNDGSKIEL